MAGGRRRPDPGACLGSLLGVITRWWRGWTTTESADAYERFLLSELFPSMQSIPGSRGADVLRRRESDEVAFVTLRVDNGNEPEKVAALSSAPNAVR